MIETSQNNNLASLEDRFNALNESVTATATLMNTVSMVLQNFQARLLSLESKLQTNKWRVTMESSGTNFVANVILDKPISTVLTDDEWMFLQDFGRQNTFADAVLVSAVPMVAV